MESKTNYTVVGMAVVGLLFGLIITALWLSKGFNRKTYHSYLVFMQEAVSGLSEGALVKYNGVSVGSVKKISLDQDPKVVRILLKIEENTPVTIDTTATLVPQGITGATYLGLSALTSNPTLLKKEPGYPYPVIPYQPSILFRLQNTIADIGKSMKSFMSEENTENFRKILNNLQQVSGLIATNDKALQSTLEQMPKLTMEMRASIARFGDMSHDVSLAGKQLNSTMVTGKNALDRIEQQAVPSAVSLLHRLDVIAANLEQLSAELRRNPAMLIRGAAPLKKGPGE